MTHPVYDYAFAGAGAAGALLSMTMLESTLAGGSFLLVDPSPSIRSSRALAFWCEGESRFEKILRHTWTRLHFASRDFEEVYDLAPYRYCMLSAADLFQEAQAAWQGGARVEFLPGRVQAIENRAEQAVLWVDGQPVPARWAFDSRFSMKDYLRRRNWQTGPGVHLVQRFHGWYIEAEKAAFDASTATLFDFRVPQEGDVRFCYVLPFDERRALVELVSLRRTAADRILDSYVRQRLKIDRYQVLSTESGASPLSDQPFPRQIGRRTLAIGVLGGLIKPSSGYAFTRMMADAECVAASLVRQGHPFDLPGRRPGFALCDALLLEVMQRHPEQMEAVFSAMFRGNSPQSIFRFLDEQASVVDMYHMAASLPPQVFIEALAQRGLPNLQPAGALLSRMGNLASWF
jgi:lycopene beta-cyclase